MRKENLLKESQRLRMFENAGMNAVAGATLISVDVQPEYDDYIDFDVREYMQFLNENFDGLHNLVFLYNGEDTLGMVSEYEYKEWLLGYGLDESIIDSCRFYDKGYAFFRYCMDNSIDDDDVIKFVQFMMKNDINDSSDLDKVNWESFMQWAGVDESEVRDLLENSDDTINIPDLIEYLEYYNGRIILTGGGIHECLKEVEIALGAMEKPYNVLTQYTY